MVQEIRRSDSIVIVGQGCEAHQSLSAHMPSTGTTGFDLNFAQAEEQWSCNLDFDGCLADGIVWLGDHWSWEESWD
jgi:hypothetical protein